MSTFPFPLQAQLSTTQIADLHRLWEVQACDIVDVRPSSEANTISKPILDDGVISRITRLHAFFMAFLSKVFGKTAEGVESNMGVPDLIGDPLVKDVGQSCLAPFVRLFFPSSTSESPAILRLRLGRRILKIHYDEFMSELNHFEFKGQPNQEALLKHSFGAYLHHFPLQGLRAVNVAMALSVTTIFRKQHSDNSQPPAWVPAELGRFLESCQLTVRFLHVKPQLNMADIKTGLVRKFISCKGHVVKARPKRLRTAMADFECQKCLTTTTHAFDQGRYSIPTKCANSNCRSRSFTLIRPTARYINIQELRIQEAQEESTSHAGRTPRQIDVILSHDLIDSCRPGDIVMLACYVDAVNSAVASGRAGKRALETSTYKLFLQGHSITTMSESNRRGQQEGSHAVYTQSQLENITRLCHADHRCLSLIERRAFPFDLLVRSLCPSIIGHHLVKAGLLLCLLGGTPPSIQSMDRGNSIRSNSHILIVGDPGMGKSQMLLAASQLAARSVYVGGNTASTTGLTVTLTKEESGETGIEAGALVLADQGVGMGTRCVVCLFCVVLNFPHYTLIVGFPESHTACIDELDKCKHLDGLLEAMEQQEVSIAKAGVVASLPARCSIVAAANPKHGSYNMSKTVAENLNMARPILSRFDLVFILRDRADKDQDRLVSSNIMDLYRNSNGSRAHHTDTTVQDEFLCKDENATNRVPLEKRLNWVTGFNDPLPAALVRDYIAYARQYCKPKLTQKAAVVLKDYYMKMRQVC